MNEIEQMIEFEISHHENLIFQEMYRDGSIRTDFERFYEKAQNFHRYINDDNLSKLKYRDLKYKDYNAANAYLHEFDFSGLVRDDSLKILVDGGVWKEVPLYLSIFDTLSSCQKVRELIERYPNVYIEWEVEEAMQIWLRKEIKRKNDEIWDIYSKEKTEIVILIDEFEDKCWDLKYKNR